MRRMIMTAVLAGATATATAGDTDNQMVQYQVQTCFGSITTITAPRLGNDPGEFSPLCETLAKLHDSEYRKCGEVKDIEDMQWRECHLRKKTIFRDPYKRY